MSVCIPDAFFSDRLHQPTQKCEMIVWVGFSYEHLLDTNLYRRWYNSHLVLDHCCSLSISLGSASDLRRWSKRRQRQDWSQERKTHRQCNVQKFYRKQKSLNQRNTLKRKKGQSTLDEYKACFITCKLLVVKTTCKAEL